MEADNSFGLMRPFWYDAVEPMLSPTQRNTAIAASWILLCTSVSFLVQGQLMEPAANWFQYLPLMAKVHDPTLYPRDDFVPLLVEKTPSWFWWVLGKWVPTVDPYLHLFWLNFFTRLVSTALLYWIAAGLAHDRRAGLIAAFLLSGQVDTVLGRGDIHWPYFTHTAASIPLLLLSLGFLLRRRWYAAFAVAGLLWNVHLLNAAYYSLFLLFWLLLSRQTLGRQRVLGCAGLLLLFALPILPRIVSVLLTQPVNGIWLHHATRYHEKLLSPFEQPLLDWLRFAGYLLLFVLMLRKQSTPQLRAPGQSMLAMWVILYCLGLLFTHLVPLPLFLKLQPCRCTDVFLLLFFVWLSQDLLQGLTSDKLSERGLHWALLTLVYYFNLRTYTSPFKETLTALWLLLVLSKAWCELYPGSREGTERQRLSTAVTWGSIAYLIVLLVLFNPWLKDTFPWILVVALRRSLLLSTLLFFLAAAYLVTRFRLTPPMPNSRRLKAFTFLLLLFLGVEWSQRTLQGALARQARTGHFLFDRFHPAFYQAARWCRQHTPPAALFIIPPYRGGFRSESLRSVFVSWDEQLALWIAPQYIREYDRRLRLLGFEPYPEQDPRTTWHPNLPQILGVQEEFGADYLVLETFKLMPLPIVYRNAQYTVYDLRSS